MAAPRTRRPTLTHHPGLDGLRGIAVLAVLLYHGGVSWLPGGFLGVEVFFVLSGFLITSLLVTEWGGSAKIALGAFWARRARRLLPALFCLVAAIGIYYCAAGSAAAIPGLKGDGISALTYYSNWHQIAAGADYFAASGPVSPLEHTWSLAIEEQFYLVWPVLLGGVLWLAARRATGASAQVRPLAAVLAVAIAGTVASSVDMALLFDGGRGLNRVYYGTDTRAASLLIGASLAFGMAIAGGRRRGRGSDSTSRRTSPANRLSRSKTFAAIALLSLAGVVATLRLAAGSSGWLYPYGLIVVDGAVALLIIAAVHAPASPAGRALGFTPLRFLGKISYGLYLWHFPLFLWLGAESTGLSGTPLLVVRLAVTLAISTASYVLIEEPIRQRRRPTWMVRALAPLAAGGAVASLLAASAATSLPVGVPAAATLPKPPAHLAGSDPACTLTLTDGSHYGLAPLPAKKQTPFEYGSLGAHQLTWSGSARKTFHTCPPKRVLLIGDSLAFTLGVPWLSDEERYGIKLADAGVLGCAFTTTGQLNVAGKWEGQSVGCPNALEQWAQEADDLHAQEVVVELGYRDQFDWKIGGKVVHLGQPAFDAALQRQIDRMVQVLGAGGRKILFLSVPYSHPPNLPDGSSAPAAAPQRHSGINAMLQAEAAKDPSNVHFLDLDETVSPGGHYSAKVKGQLCRFDGVHFSVYCSKLLEPRVLGEARKLLG